jgi:hypothetical protein
MVRVQQEKAGARADEVWCAESERAGARIL